MLEHRTSRNLGHELNEMVRDRRPPYDSGWTDLSVKLDGWPVATAGSLKFSTWSVGVITAPRRESTVARCLEALEDAGWPNYTVWGEPGSQIGCIRRNRLGQLGNWRVGLAELVSCDRSADAYLIIEDDAILHRESRKLLESSLWPDDLGLLSLYCSAAYDRDGDGWYRLGMPWYWGALALVIPAAVAFDLLSTPGLWSADDVCSDLLVGKLVYDMGLSAAYPCPSLVRHIGGYSTVGPWSNSGNRREARCLR